MSFYKEVPGRQTTLESTLKFDTAPTAGSTNPVTSDGVNTAITDAVGGASDALQEQIDDIAEKAGSGYVPKGEATVATLNGLSGQENGELYTMTDSGTLTYGSLAVVAGDTVAWDEANSVWYKAMDYAPRQYGTNEVHNLPTTITAFRTGDVIPVDGPDGTAKMGKDDLLKVTAENALDLADPVIGTKLNATALVDRQYLPTKTINLHLTMGSVDPDTGALIPSGERARTDYIDVYELKKITYNSFSWMRCYDSEYNYLGTPEGYAHKIGDFYSDYVLAALPSTKYVIFVVTTYQAVDVSADFYFAPDNSYFKETNISLKAFPMEHTSIEDKVLPVVFGTVNPDTGVFEPSTDRERTELIQINDVYSISVETNIYFWIRCYDQHQKYIGTPTFATYVKNKTITIDELVKALPETSYFCVLVMPILPASNVVQVTAKVKTSLNSFASVRNSALIKDVPFSACKPIESSITNSSGSVDPDTGALIPSGDRVRTDYIDVDSFDKIDVETGKFFWVRCYDSEKNYLGTMEGYQFISDKAVYSKSAKISFSNNSLRYIIIVVAYSAPVTITRYVSGSVRDDFSLVSFIEKNYLERTGTQEKFWYNVGDDCTTGRLMLPSNYDPAGKPVPLIVYCQGSADYNTINGDITNNYITYYKYLCDCGFAIFSCYGWGKKYVTDGAIGINTPAVGTWNSPTNKKCWEAGIKFVLSNYNLDANNIFVTAKSQGGTQAFPLYFGKTINFRAAGLLAPTASDVQGYFGYATSGVVNTRKLFLDELGIDYTGESWIDKDVANFTSTDLANFGTFCENNYKTFCGWDSYYYGLAGITPLEITDYLNTNKNAFDTDSFKRFGSFGCPLRIWFADDDINISPALLKGVVRSLTQGGCVASVRLMPNGTGGHHSVDNSPLALQTQDVTTRLGVHYDEIPTAYYELSQFFIDNEV